MPSDLNEVNWITFLFDYVVISLLCYAELTEFIMLHAVNADSGWVGEVRV